MRRGEEVADKGQIAQNFKELRDSSFGKVKGAEIQRQKTVLGKAGMAFTDATASALDWASNNLSKAAVGTVGLVAAGWLGYKGLKNRKSGASGIDKFMTGGVDKLAIQKVFVTNFPSSMQSPRDALKDKRDRMPDKSGAPSVPGQRLPQATKMGQFLGGLKGTFKKWQHSGRR